jgi:ubiquinone biosynthesis protein COQ4
LKGSKEMARMKAIKNRLLAARAIWSFIDLVRNPDHLDRVFEIADAMSEQKRDVLQRMCDHFAMDPRGAAALRDKPRLVVRLEELSALPAGTLGRSFADHMRTNGLDPSALPALSSETDLQFVRAHLRETHDVWHAVTGFATDVAGELGLQAFYAAQSPGGFPLALIAMGFLNAALFDNDDRVRRFQAVVDGWEMGKRAERLFGVRWDELWDRPIDEVRALLGVKPQAGEIRAAA